MNLHLLLRLFNLERLAVEGAVSTIQAKAKLDPVGRTEGQHHGTGSPDAIIQGQDMAITSIVSEW
jgi:hypothetical protein